MLRSVELFYFWSWNEANKYPASITCTTEYTDQVYMENLILIA